ncbi:MAG: sulfur carrier protein ThiS [Nitrospinota bacterium]
MRLIVNGDPQEFPGPLTLEELLERLELSQPHIAVAVNMEVIPRGRFSQVELQEGDKLEIIRAVGGG